jgi:hypothetical protein
MSHKKTETPLSGIVLVLHQKKLFISGIYVLRANLQFAVLRK